MHSIGLWFKKYPGHFLDGTYLRYVGWVLSDANTQVRLEAVKSLSGVYENSDYISSLQTFTERFKPRLVEMATRDTELAVRVAVIGILGSIDTHQLLEDEQREELCMLIFDEDAKVRRAVSKFVGGVWAEIVEQLAGGKVSSQERTRAGIKALGKLLVRLAKPLGKKAVVAEDEEESLNGVTPSPMLRRVREVAALVGTEQRGRIALAVEALWEDVESVSDWEALLEVLLLDHSAGTDAVQGSRGRRLKSSKGSTDSTAGEAWRLEEVEEAVLLEVFVASLGKAKASAAAAKKVHAFTFRARTLVHLFFLQGEEDTVVSDITRALIKSLPRLFTKHQTDEARIAVVLSIPLLMNLDLYLEMRMTTVGRLLGIRFVQLKYLTGLY